MTPLEPLRGELCRFRLADGRYASVVPLTFGRARIHVYRDLTGVDEAY